MPLSMDWNALPSDMKELILSKLPVADLASVATTSKDFQAAFYSNLAGEQKACYNFAVKPFGREVIISITTLVDALLKGVPPGAILDETPLKAWHWISRDNKWVTDKPVPGVGCYRGMGIMRELNPPLEVCIDGALPNMAIKIYTRNDTRVGIYVHPQDEKSIISLDLHTRSDFEGVSLLYALLCEGLPRIFRDSGRQVEIEVLGVEYLKVLGGLTHAQFKATVVCFLPYLARNGRTLVGRRLAGVLK
jgi:hypothetical protein